MTDPATQPAAGYAAALASLPGMGPATLVDLLNVDEPAGAWARVRSGEIHRGEPRRGQPTGHRRSTWAEVAERTEPVALADACRAAGIQVTWWGDDRYPAALRDDPQPAGVLFWRGDLACVDRPCVAVVGTRRATHDGRTTAFEIGRDLAAAGICVISGLALGIDGAAHAGALSMQGVGTLGVAASGVDVPYPSRHTRLWELVVGQGAVCSEAPPGQPAQAWRFPSRNRLIAGLSRLVVVVESHATGGSLLTAEAALARGIEVAAVPGPVRSPASAGSNQLLTDGPAPVRHAGDVLDLLGRVAAWPPAGYHQRPRRLAPTVQAPRESPRPRRGDPDCPLSEEARRVLGALGWRSISLNRIVEVCGLPVSVVARCLDDLEAAGLVTAEGSWWRRERA
jgi:DNA processing protein